MYSEPTNSCGKRKLTAKHQVEGHESLIKMDLDCINNSAFKLINKVAFCI